MGNLRKMHSQGRIRKGKTNRDPLRKIVGYENGLEVLECGHHQRPREDFIGVTNATRRRCWKCQREQEAGERTTDSEPQE